MFARSFVDWNVTPETMSLQATFCIGNKKKLHRQPPKDALIYPNALLVSLYPFFGINSQLCITCNFVSPVSCVSPSLVLLVGDRIHFKAHKAVYV
jgi:hypothetical protein